MAFCAPFIFPCANGLSPSIIKSIFTIFLFTQPTLQLEECGGGSLKPEVVQGTAFSPLYTASNIFNLSGQTNYWLAKHGKTTGQGFTMKVDVCTRIIVGCHIKNLGKGVNSGRIAREFRVSGSLDQNGPWETLLEDQLVDTRNKAASLLNFTFDEPVEVQFIKFDLVSYWGKWGGGLQYFAAIPGKNGQMAQTTTDGAITSSTADSVTTLDADKEAGLDFKSIGYSFIISVPVILIVLGIVFMCRTYCKICLKCCKCCSSDLEREKEDENVDYGAYYYDDGERRQDVMEVQDSNPAYETAHTESNFSSHASAKNPQNVNVDQLDDYDYIGNHDDYDYMGS